jgi:hypothetical protein
MSLIGHSVRPNVTDYVRAGPVSARSHAGCSIHRHGMLYL